MSKNTKEENVTIKAPSISTAAFKIVGTSPYIQLRFSQKAIETMMAKMAAGSQANKKKAREARDFDADFEAAKHISTEGWCGIPASAFRNALISACRLVGFRDGVLGLVVVAIVVWRIVARRRRVAGT
jgi:hypothetical protein